MEENGTTATQKFVCSGDCLRCSSGQRVYCASQHAYHTMRLLQKVEETVHDMSGTIEELKAKISAIQDNEAMVFDPAHHREEETTQEGDGEENRSPI